MSEIDWDSDVISSKDIIDRHEELTSEYEVLLEDLDYAKKNLEIGLQQCLHERVDEAQAEVNNFIDFKLGELLTLEKVIAQGEDYGDWSYGESLINEKYFVDHISSIINDCYTFSSEMNEGTWPYNHISLDYKAAAEEAKVDYVTIEVGDYTFYMRA